MSRYRLMLGLGLVMLGVGLTLATAVAATPGGGPRRLKPGVPAAQALTAEALRQKAVAFAGGPLAWPKVHSFSFDFVSGTDPKAPMVHHHAYDADKHLYRYSCTLDTFAHTNYWKDDHWMSDSDLPKGKELVAIYHFPRLEGTVYIDGKPLSGKARRAPWRPPLDENMRLLRRVNDSVANDRYFAFLPLIVNNPSVHVDLAPPVEDPKYGYLEGFTAWSGTDKAKNKTLWTLYLTPKGELVRTDIVVLNGQGPLTVLWEKWKQFGPVRLPQEHYIPKLKRTFRHEHIQINKPVKIEPPR